MNPNVSPTTKQNSLPSVYPGVIALCNYLKQFSEEISQEWKVEKKGNQVDISLSYRYKSDQFKPNEKIVSFSFSLQSDKLWDAYCALPEPELNYDFTQNPEYLHVILKITGIEMLRHVRIFTGFSDNYPAIAEMCNFTGVNSKLLYNKFGL